jgi:purine-nucleoside phosphorylase
MNEGMNGPPALSATPYARAFEAARYLRSRLGAVPDVLTVLGSGLGAFAGSLTDPVTIDYATIPHWPVPTVTGHAGRLVAGLCGSRPVLLLSGRSHRYEGRSLEDITFGIRVAGLLGVKTVVLTNAAGGINPDFAVGDLMVIDDHINLMGVNPLTGPNDERFGPRFPDMSEVYARRLRSLAHDVGRELGDRLQHGVYLAVSGPSYETPAEIVAFRTLGADAVGMSTVPEAVVARHMNLEVLGLSCISNLAAGMLPQSLSEAEVLETTARVRDRFVRLLEALLGRL